ncbi:MAG: YihY/virulence factor BrkB family protein [Peptococcaceae bacterium]|nr:YihY/virulence factor BrkB family protein [Peptococcaceae bacterium]
MDWRKFFIRFWELVNNNELMAVGGQVTYYMILSFFPLLIFVLTLAGYANLSSEQVFEEFKYLIPNETYLLVESIIYEIFTTRSPTLLSIGMLGAAWASLNGIHALLRGMVKAYGIKENRSFFRQKFISVTLLIIFVVTLLGSFSLLFLGEMFGDWLFHIMGAASIFQGFWHVIRLLIQFILLVITFIIINRMATGPLYTIRKVFPGSLFTAIGWVLISLGFTFYFKHFNSYTVTYGSIGGVMVLLLWLYWSIVILLLGCVLNAVLISKL